MAALEYNLTVSHFLSHTFLDGKLVQLNSTMNYEIIVTEIGINMITKDRSTNISVTHNSGGQNGY